MGFEDMSMGFGRWDADVLKGWLRSRESLFFSGDIHYAVVFELHGMIRMSLWYVGGYLPTNAGRANVPRCWEIRGLERV